MTVEDREPSGFPPPPDPRRDTVEPDTSGAQQRHRVAMRRAWRWYGAAIALVLVVVAGFLAVVWSHSEITHVTLRTAAGSARSIPLSVTSATPTLGWQTDDRAAIGLPYEKGTVVTYSSHTVSGRDGGTGAVRWSYERSDRVVCQVVQEQGRTVAIYRHDDLCDEVTTLDTSTGMRMWTRTVTDDGNPPTIYPTTFALILVTPGAAHVPSQVHAIDYYSGIDFWIYNPDPGCRVTTAVPGSTGVLIALDCGGTRSLVLRDRYLATDNADKKNPILFTVQSDLIPASADDVLSGYDPSTGTLALLDHTTGKTVAEVRLGNPDPTTPAITQAVTDMGELIHLDGTTFSLTATTRDTAQWSASTPTLPTVVTLTADDDPASGQSVLTAASSDGVVTLDPETGHATTTRPVSDAPGGSLAYPFGTGYILATPTGTRIYR